MKEKIPYTPPEFGATGFNCPFCNAFANQDWGCPDRPAGKFAYGADKNFYICRCSRCGRFSIWILKKMVYPRAKTALLPNPDLPEEVKKDYEEARNILSESPRGASALLRLAIQKLCIHLGEKGEILMMI